MCVYLSLYLSCVCLHQPHLSSGVCVIRNTLLPSHFRLTSPSHLKDKGQRGSSVDQKLCDHRDEQREKDQQQKPHLKKKGRGKRRKNTAEAAPKINAEVDKDGDDDDADDEDDDDDDSIDEDGISYTQIRTIVTFKDFLLLGTAKTESSDETDSNATQTPTSSSSSPCDHLVDSSMPALDQKEQRILEMQRMKANCKSEDLDRLRTRCEILVRNCIVGLLGEMADEEFLKMEGWESN